MKTIEYLRHFRIGEYAIFDFVVSFVAVFLLAPLLSLAFRKVGINIPKISWLYLTLPISIVTHLAVGTMTPMTQNFLNPHGHYILKLLIVVLLILGLKDIGWVQK
ncbi:hypothetical protein ACFLZY_03110 [Patescibacteria group bacterium]